MSHTVTLVKTVYTIDQLEELDLPQVALAGRSNVGKSTLLNKLAGRKNLAKTSATPGKTRSLNFFHVAPENFYLVDLPGYGYARCSKEEREKWAKLTSKYLEGNTSLRGIVALLDSRLTPQRIDIDLVQYISAQNISLLPVLTKADKCKQTIRKETQAAWKRLLPNQQQPLLISSHSGMNIDNLWKSIISFLG